jgi:hypothetical protein
MTRFPLASLLTGAFVFLLEVGDAAACAVCTGTSDSPLAQGMNWGILTLLVVVVGVLFGIAAFFTYLARRAAAIAPEPTLSNVSEPSQELRLTESHV